MASMSGPNNPPPPFEGPLVVPMSQLPDRIVRDIRDYCDDNPRQYVEFGDLMVLQNVLKAYLEYNGVIGYTSDVMTIFMASYRQK